jgi:hypothetical protein
MDPCRLLGWAGLGWIVPRPNRARLSPRFLLRISLLHSTFLRGRCEVRRRCHMATEGVEDLMIGDPRR